MNAREYLESHPDLIAAHKARGGAAASELELLIKLEDGVSSGPGGLIGDLNRTVVQEGPPDPGDDIGKVYVMTHTIFYATDFGRAPIEVDGAAWTERLQDLIRRCWDNTDVLGELLMCTVCLGLWGDWTTDARAHHLELWNALDTSEEGFEANYHAIMIGGCLAALLGE